MGNEPWTGYYINPRVLVSSIATTQVQVEVQLTPCVFLGHSGFFSRGLKEITYLRGSRQHFVCEDNDLTLGKHTFLN